MCLMPRKTAHAGTSMPTGQNLFAMDFVEQVSPEGTIDAVVIVEHARGYVPAKTQLHVHVIRCCAATRASTSSALPAALWIMLVNHGRQHGGGGTGAHGASSHTAEWATAPVARARA